MPTRTRRAPASKTHAERVAAMTDAELVAAALDASGQTQADFARDVLDYNPRGLRFVMAGRNNLLKLARRTLERYLVERLTAAESTPKSL